MLEESYSLNVSCLIDRYWIFTKDRYLTLPKNKMKFLTQTLNSFYCVVSYWESGYLLVRITWLITIENCWCDIAEIIIYLVFDYLKWQFRNILLWTGTGMLLLMLQDWQAWLPSLSVNAFQIFNDNIARHTDVYAYNITQAHKHTPFL